MLCGILFKLLLEQGFHRKGESLQEKPLKRGKESQWPFFKFFVLEYLVTHVNF